MVSQSHWCKSNILMLLPPPASGSLNMEPLPAPHEGSQAGSDTEVVLTQEDKNCNCKITDHHLLADLGRILSH